MENGTVTQGEGGKDPSGFLGEIIGHQVRVKLNSGVVYRGLPVVPLLVTRLLTLSPRRAAISRWIHEHCS